MIGQRLFASTGGGIGHASYWTTTAIENPYEPPKAASHVAGERWNRLRGAFFAIDFVAAVLLTVSCVISVAAPESPFQFLGAIMSSLPVILYAVCEWLAFYHRKHSVERKLGYVNLGFAALAGFAVVTTIGEVIMSDEPTSLQFLFWFTLIGCVITAHLALSGWCRLQWTAGSSPG